MGFQNPFVCGFSFSVFENQFLGTGFFVCQKKLSSKNSLSWFSSFGSETLKTVLCAWFVIAVELSRQDFTLPTPPSSSSHLLSWSEISNLKLLGFYPLTSDRVGFVGWLGFLFVGLVPIFPFAFSPLADFPFFLWFVLYFCSDRWLTDRLCCSIGLMLLVGFARLPCPEFPLSSVISVVFLLWSFPSPNF